MNKTATQVLNEGYRPLRTSADLSGNAIRTTRRSPPKDLQPYVMEFWEYEVSSEFDYVPVQVFPNGCLSIRFNIKPDDIEPVLYGPSVNNDMKGLFYRDWTIFGAALWPSRSYQLLGLAVDEMRDLRVHLDCVWPQAMPYLCEQMQLAENMHERVAVLSSFLRRTLRTQVTGHADFLNAFRELVLQAPGASDLGLIAKRTGISNRSLRRSFHKYLGLGPKETQRLLKIQRGIKALARQPQQELAHLSLEAGFSDQPHFSRSFREFVGISPSRFAGLVGNMHNKDLDIWSRMDPTWRDRPVPKIIRFE